MKLKMKDHEVKKLAAEIKAFAEKHNIPKEKNFKTKKK